MKPLHPWGNAVRHWRSTLFVCALITLVSPEWPHRSALAAQQRGSIRGRVLDAATGEPLPRTVVSVLGTNTQAMTGADGSYFLAVTAGAQRIRAERFEYLPQTRDMTIPPRQEVALDFVLSRSDSPERRERAVLVALGADSLPTQRLRFTSPDSVRIRHRQVRFQRFDPVPGRTINLPLFPDVDLLARSTHVVRTGVRRFRWVGELLDEHGMPYGSVILVVHENFLTGNIHFEDRIFEIRPLDERVHLVVEVDPRLFPPEPPLPPPIPPRPGPPLPVPWPPWLPPYQPAPWQFEGGIVWPQPSSGDACSDMPNLITNPEVRLLVVYSQAAGQIAKIEAEIELMVEQLNIALVMSMIPLRVVLAHVMEIAVDDPATLGANAQLQRLTNPSDTHADAVHSLRDRYHADAVVLVLQNMPAGAANTLEKVTLAHENAAFAVVNRSYGTTVFGFTHEVGHLLSGHHERWPAVAIGYPYRYNFGFVQARLDYTVMANKSAGVRLNRFSNPDQSYEGEPLGVASTEPDAADNRRALSNAASIVSAFRLTPVWFTSMAGVGPWVSRLATDDGPELARFGDFDADGELDAFRIDPEAGSWEWSRSASSDWVVLNPTAGGKLVTVEELGFGDFDGDDRTDVFRSDPAAGTWYWSSAGIADWAMLNAQIDPAVAASELVFADFNGDGRTDVFWSDVAGMTWRWSDAGATKWSDLQGPDPALAINTHQLGFADFDDDERADVFRADPVGKKWLWSRGGVVPWALLNGSPALTTDLHELGFGDFDGDGTADVFTADGKSWLVSAGGSAPLQIVRTSCHRRPVLRFGDFDGDGTTDVIRAGIRP